VHNNPVAGGLVYKDTKPHERIRAVAWWIVHFHLSELILIFKEAN
jgi:hypothetical protein